MISGIRAAVTNHFVGGWGERTPVSLDNSPFQPKVSEPWARLSVNFEDSTQPAMQPGRVTRLFGDVVVQVFTPEGVGTETADGLLGEAMTILNQRKVSGMTFRTPDFAEPKNNPKGYYQVRLSVPFYCDVMEIDP